MKDLSRKVTLFCDVCGNDQFIKLDEIECELCDAPDETRIQCLDCRKVFTKTELLEVNQEVINANIEEIKSEAIKEMEKKLAKALRKWR